MKLFAEFISFLFHPVVFFLLMPFFIVYRNTESSFYALKWELFSLAFIIFGIIIVFLGKKRGVFTDLDVSVRNERFEFYTQLFFFGLVYVGVALLFRGIFFPMSLIAIGIIVGIIIFAILNKYIKASNHLAVACAFILTLTLLGGIQYFLVSFWIIPLLGWARLFLKKHTIKEMVAGGVVGIGITLFTFFLGKYIYTG